ncbi:MAG: hypothetical protein ABR910_03055 [Acidobacteriaceae bacterium]|jgi:hypothetical protein
MNHRVNQVLSRRTFLSHGAAALALSRASFAHAAPTTPTQTTPTPIPFGQITAGGDLAHRAAQNFARLQTPLYRSPQLFNGVNVHSWPGDFEGRALLALTLMSRATGQPPAYLPALVAEYPAHLNSQGYFGPPLDLHAINEQQLSGHGWYLRALCEYYDWQRDPATLAQIQTIARNFALPLRGSYATYPIDPATRLQATAPTAPGAVDGHLNGQHGDWAVSSDTGCAFIFLDGLAHAWVTLKAANDASAPALRALIGEAIARFLQADLVAIQAQTHASLTAMRALLRVYSQTAADGHPDPTLLAAAESRFALYKSVAMTEHYANYNWFGRPETWTEPCAIIDSFMIATQLWQHTANPAYLEDAHLIWANGIGRGLRGNGGFGTDLCAGYKTPFLKVRSYEASFCCTMRGGEGHARAIQSLYFTSPCQQSIPVLPNSPGTLFVPFYADSEATVDLGHGPILLRQTTTYPYGGKVRIEIVSAPKAPILACFFTPPWTSNQRLTLNGRPLGPHPDLIENRFMIGGFTPSPGDVVQLDFDLRVAPRDTINPRSIAGYYAFQAGPLLLGYQAPAVTAPAAQPTPAPAAASASPGPTSPPTARPPRPTPPPDPAELFLPRNAKLIPTTTPGAYRVEGAEILLTRINDLNDANAAPRDPCTRQILFRQA